MELPEKVIFAVDIAVPDKALFRQAFVAVGTLQAFRVPILVQHLVNEPIQDHQSATGAFGYRGCNNKIPIKKAQLLALDDYVLEVWYFGDSPNHLESHFKFFKRSVGADL